MIWQLKVYVYQKKKNNLVRAVAFWPQHDQRELRLNWGQLSKMESDWLTGMKGTSCTLRAVISLKSYPSAGAWTEHRCVEIAGYGGETQDYLFSWTLLSRALSFSDSIAVYYCCFFCLCIRSLSHILNTYYNKLCLTSCTATISWLDV